MGSKIDKMDESLLEHAPLDEQLITDLYFVHDAFRYMDMLSLACEAILRPSLAEARGRSSPLEDFGLILKSCGKKMGAQSTFSKVLIASGNIEILIGRMENVWAYEIENILLKPIHKCLLEHSRELTIKRDEIMRVRVEIKEAKLNKSNDVKTLEKEYRVLQDELKDRLIQEKRTIAEFWKHLTKILSAQLNMTRNSTVHLESLVEILQKNPKKVNLTEEDLKDESFSFMEHHRSKYLSKTTSGTSDVLPKTDLPEFSKIILKNKKNFSNFLTKKLLQTSKIVEKTSVSNMLGKETVSNM